MILALFLFLVIITRIIIELIKYSLSHYQTYQLIKKIPGPDIRFPFWGNISLLSEILSNKPPGQQSKDLMCRLSKEYDSEHKFGVIRLWFGPFVPIVIVTDANIAQSLLNSKYHLDKATFYSLFRFAIYDGIFTCKTERWFHNKRELQDHLKLKSLQNYIPNTKRHLSKLMERIDKCTQHNDGIFPDIKPVISTFVLDVLGENLFSTEFGSQEKECEPDFVHSVHNLLEISYIAFLKPWTYFFRKRYIAYLFNINNIKNSVYHIINFRKTTRKIITNRFKQMKKIAANDETPGPYVSMLDSMINVRTKDSKIVNIRHIESQINTFIIAGHDTTTSSLTWTLYLLGHHPEKQQKLIEEIDQFVNNLKTNNEPLTLFNMKRLKYLDSCIMESLRLYPSGPYIARRSREPFLLNNGITLPANANYIIFILHMHMNEQYFRKPEQFIPERFIKIKQLQNLDNESPWMTYSAFLPFSGGHRMCLGKEYGMLQQRMFFINLLSKYRIRSLDRFGQCEPKFNFLLSSAHFPVQFQRRHF